MGLGTVWLFPGQGAQYPGMGKDVVESFPEAKRVLEEADDQLHFNLSKLILEGTAESLSNTASSQLAIFVMSWAILTVLQKQFGLTLPLATAGLSLGEYTALVAAGYLNFLEGLEIIQLRGAFMREACEKKRGGMAVVLGLSADQVCRAIEGLSKRGEVWGANFNCPGQVVIAGTIAGLEKVKEPLLVQGAKRIIPLNVQGAFHSPLMESAQHKLEPYIERLSLNPTSTPIVMNVTGERVIGLGKIKEYLNEQMVAPVLWQKGIHTLETGGVSAYLEIGPGKTLAGFNKRIGTTAPTYSIDSVAAINEFVKRKTT